jgi:hypothetical protein
MDPVFVTVTLCPAPRTTVELVFELIVTACAGAVGSVIKASPTRAVVPMSVAFSVLDPNIVFSPAF